MKNKLNLYLNKGMFISTLILCLIALLVDFVTDICFIGYEDLYGKTGIAWYFSVHLILLALLCFTVSLFFRKVKDKSKGGYILNILFCVYIIVFGLSKFIVLLNQTDIKCLLLTFDFLDYIVAIIDIIVPILILSLFRNNFKVSKILLLVLSFTNVIYLLSYLIIGIIKVGISGLISISGVYALTSIAYLILTIISIFLMKNKEE